MAPLTFPPVELAPEHILALRRFNPWWEGGSLPALPPHRRHLVAAIDRLLEIRLAPVVVVRGPRQVGKSTAQLQILEDLLARGVDPRRILRIQCDDLPMARSSWAQPLLRFVDWYEATVLGRTLNQAARAGEPAFLFLDEVQILPDWAPQLKSLVDASTVQVLVTGSSAMRIERGRDSLAGRITTLEAGTLSLTEIGLLHGVDVGGPFLNGENGGTTALGRLSFWHDLAAHGRQRQEERDRLFALFAERGGYPVAHQHPDVPWSEIADQLNETVIQRVLRQDLRAEELADEVDPVVLEAIFYLSCRYAGQVPSAVFLSQELRRSQGIEARPEMVLRYQRLLADTLLVRLIQVLEQRLRREKLGAKICLADHSLRASWLAEIIPLEPRALAAAAHLAPVAGHLAESVVGAVLSTIRGLDLAHRPARPAARHGGEPEIDFVLRIGFHHIPLEVKYRRRIDPRRDTAALGGFLDQKANHAPFGLLVTQGESEALDDPRIVALPLSSLMLLR